jgi:hypothetical protein
MLTEQLALGASVARHVFVCEKLEASAPVIEMEFKASSWLPVLTIEKTCVGLVTPTTLLKVAVEGKIETAGPETAWLGFPEMAKPPQQLAEAPVLKGEPEISVRFPVCVSTW